MADNLTLAVNHAIGDAISRARMRAANPLTGIDGKRPQAWCEYGFPQEISFEDFAGLYRRGGLAHGAVNKLIGTCWKTPPQVIEGEEQDRAKELTAWEKAIKPVFARVRLWRAFAEADKRRLVGRYSGLLLQLRDSRAWDQPVTSGAKALAKVIPAWAGSLTPQEFDTDPKSERYGEPKMWQYTETLAGGSVRRRTIHPDRVFILGDYSGDAIGFLEPAFNAFISLEKVEGGSGESFLKNAARQLGVNFDKEVNLNEIAAMYGVSVDQLQQKFNDAAREVNRGNDLMLITQGATTSALVSNIPDPRPTYDINLQTVSAALDIPSKILVGMQTGERASSEDQKYFNARCQSRRGELTYEINDFVAHLMRIGVVDRKAEFTAIWDDLTSATQADKLGEAKIMAEINAAALASGDAVFSPEEIRDAAGFEPEEQPDPLPDEDDDDGEGTDPAGEPSRPDRR
nr:DUF1073 domain-containing protein [Gammaproteobacteria bacterium]